AIEKSDAGDGGKSAAAPGGMIHDWVGTVFVPGVKLEETLALEEDYDRHAEIFQPEVMRSKILKRNGGNFTVYFRLRKKKIITTILDTDHEVQYHVIDAKRAESRSRTTRIQEVENAGEKNESLKPAGDDNGFLWRMNTYWRL